MSEIQGLGVYDAINKVQADLAAEGIAKDRNNQGQGFKFRGIDDIYNAISAVLAKHKLCIIPRYTTRSCEERQTAKGGTIFYVVVDGEYDVVSAVDGSSHSARTFGEAMDSADKATNKAMSAAYKYLCMQLFCIPTEGDNDADASHYDLAPRQQQPLTPEQQKYEKNYNIIDGMLGRLDQQRQDDAVHYFRTTYNVDRLNQLPLTDLLTYGNWLKATYFTAAA